MAKVDPATCHSNADFLLWARQAAAQPAKTHCTHYTQTLILCASHLALLARAASWTSWSPLLKVVASLRSKLPSS